MSKTFRRLSVVYRHVTTGASRRCSTGTAPILSVSPTTCLVDERVRVRVRGLSPHQLVTLTSRVEEAGNQYEARGTYRAGQDGSVDSTCDPCQAGTYTGVEPMGLFWSVQPYPDPSASARLMKKDVASPMKFVLSVYDGSLGNEPEIRQAPLTTAVVNRLYKRPGVRRIPVTDGPYRGTIFVPEGRGPFPGLMDTYGGLISLVETRAALLASHGYATFALAYLYQDHLPQTVFATKPSYFKEAGDWFIQHDYVDEDNFGLVGLCFGGAMSLRCAAIDPKVKVVVNINGLPVHSASHLTEIEDYKYDPGIPENTTGKRWPDSDLVYLADDGLVVSDVYDNYEDTICIPVWRHGAKILTIASEADRQVPLRWHEYVRDRLPEGCRDQVELVTYPGAGHLVDPPYSPLCHTVNPGYAKMATIDFMKQEFWGLPMAAGGSPLPHARAQEDAWARILDFLHTNLKQAGSDT